MISERNLLGFTRTHPLLIKTNGSDLTVNYMKTYCHCKNAYTEKFPQELYIKSRMY
jgi:hypothetical protein